MKQRVRLAVGSVSSFVLLLVALSVWPLGAAGPAAKPEDVGMSSDRLRRIHELVQRHIDAKSFSGAVTLVARNGRVAHLEAHGLMDIASQKPMATNGIFVVPDTLPGRASGEGYGLSVRVVTSPVARNTFLSQGSFGWSGAFGTHFWIDPKEKVVGILMTQTANQEIRPDFENTVMQGIIEPAEVRDRTN